jgi:S-adenosylmethionine hydrolase
MPIITFTTDWRNGDFYEPAVKGYILTKCPDAIITNISNHIEPYNVSQAAFIVKHSFSHFPIGTIHIIGVNKVIDKLFPYLVIRFQDHYFIGADNGMFGLIIEEQPQEIFRIHQDLYEKKGGYTFPELHILTNAACEIYNGRPLHEIGVKITEYYKNIAFLPVYEDSSITGKVMYIDSYYNAITNISQKFFDEIGKGRPFTIYIKSKRDKIQKINQYYDDSEENDLLAIFNSIGLLEIAIHNAYAAQLFNLDTNSLIRIDFHDTTN